MRVALEEPALAEGLVLVDALRLGDARVAGRAAELLRERLQGVAVPA